jgi:hypothetical protein
VARTPGRSTAPKAQPGTGVRFAAGPAAERTERTTTCLQAPLDAFAACYNTPTAPPRHRPPLGKIVPDVPIMHLAGLPVQFSHGGCGIRQPKISQLPAADPTPTVAADFGGWVFPKGGVAFVWVFDAQMAKGS